VADGYHAKVGDFGLSASLSRSISSLPRARVRGGTPRYTAPELLSSSYGGSPGGATTASDVYSFAIMLNQVFAGIPPYRDHPQHHDQSFLLDLVLETGTRPTVAALVHTNPILSQIVTTGWSAQPEARPSFRRIAEELAYVASTMRAL
jgi:serine/threonine protein kinase